MTDTPMDIYELHLAIAQCRLRPAPEGISRDPFRVVWRDATKYAPPVCDSVDRIRTEDVLFVDDNQDLHVGFAILDPDEEFGLRITFYSDVGHIRNVHHWARLPLTPTKE